MNHIAEKQEEYNAIPKKGHALAGKPVLASELIHAKKIKRVDEHTFMIYLSDGGKLIVEGEMEE